MLIRKKWINIVWIIPPTILITIEDFMFEKSSIPIENLLIGKVFGQTYINDVSVFIIVIEKLIYLVIFNLLYGNFISEDFRYNSVYLFSRIKNRKTWFYKKASELLLLAAFYTMIFLLTNLVICVSFSTCNINKTTWLVFGMMFLMITMLLTITSLVINLISIQFGNSLGFISVYTTVLVLIYIALQGQDIAVVKKYPLLMVLNPVSGVSINYTEMPYFHMVLIIYYIILILAVFLLGAAYINRLDIALKDVENI